MASLRKQQDSSRMSSLAAKTIEADPYRTPDLKNLRNRAKYVQSRDSNDSRRSNSERRTILIKK